MLNEALPTVCPECGVTQLSWAVHLTTGSSGIANGQLRLADVTALAVLSCDECSETVAAVDAEEALIRFADPLVVVTNFDELEALPLGSIVTGDGDTVAIKIDVSSSANDDDRWNVTGVFSYEVDTSYLGSGPWTVLRRGGPCG